MDDLPTHTSFNADPVTPLDMDSVSIWLSARLLGTLLLPPMNTPTPTPADRMALAMCPNIRKANGHGCAVPCDTCRRISAAVAHEIARQLRERHGGSSQVADWLDGVGCHTGTAQTVQEVFHV